MLDIARSAFPRMYFGSDVVLAILPFFHIYGAWASNFCADR
jgi:hypothetical protein